MKNMQKTMEKSKKQKKTKSSDPWARSGERPGWGHRSELFVFCFSMVFCSLAKTSRKPKKKVQTHGQGLGRGLAEDMGLNFLFFLFFVFPWFFAIWPKPRENKKKHKVQTHGQGLGRGLAGDMGLNFLFFLVFWFFHGFLQFGQNLEKTQKKQKKTKSSDPWARSGERPGWGHGSELFVFFFFVFPWFFAIWPKPRENPKKKVQTHGQGLGRGLAGDMGLNFLVFLFFLFFLVFCNLAKTSRKPPKKKNKKFRPMGKVWGEAWLRTWV